MLDLMVISYKYLLKIGLIIKDFVTNHANRSISLDVIGVPTYIEEIKTNRPN